MVGEGRLIGKPASCRRGGLPPHGGDCGHGVSNAWAGLRSRRRSVLRTGLALTSRRSGASRTGRLCMQVDVDCSVFGAEPGAPSTVCDGTSGACAVAPVAGGPCCHVDGLFCLAGPTLNATTCTSLTGSFSPTAQCTPTGCTPWSLRTARNIPMSRACSAHNRLMRNIRSLSGYACRSETMDDAHESQADSRPRSERRSSRSATRPMANARRCCRDAAFRKDSSIMLYLPPNGPIPGADGVAGTIITIGTPLLMALAFALALCLALVGVVMLAGRQSARREARRWIAVATPEPRVPTVRRAAGGTR